MKKTLLSAIILASVVYLPTAYAVEDWTEIQTPTLTAPGTYDIGSATLLGDAFTLSNFSVYDANGNFDVAIDLSITDPVFVSYSLSAANGVQLTGVYLEDDNTGISYNQGLSFNAATGVYSSSADLGLLAGPNWELEVYGTITGAITTTSTYNFEGSLVSNVAEPEQIALMLLGLSLVSLATRRK